MYPRVDSTNRLRHLAFVIDGLATAGPPAAAAAAAFAAATALLPAALAAEPGPIDALTFFAPELRDPVLTRDEAVIAACAAGLSHLAGAARGAGAVFRLLGRTDRIPAPLAAPGDGAAGPGPLVGWFLDYGSRDEILRAAGRIPAGAAIDEEGFAALLDTAGIPDPDLVLYVGGDFEPKDFLLWQASYAELWHTPTPWPEFTAPALGDALADFAGRQRRFGG